MQQTPRCAFTASSGGGESSPPTLGHQPSALFSLCSVVERDEEAAGEHEALDGVAALVLARADSVGSRMPGLLNR